jgi:hypothetical protein
VGSSDLGGNIVQELEGSMREEEDERVVFRSIVVSSGASGA